MAQNNVLSKNDRWSDDNLLVLKYLARIMPKEPFICQNAEELHAMIGQRRGIPLDTQKAIDMLRDLKVAWDRALATDPLQRPQPAEHPTITAPAVSPGVQTSVRPNSPLQHGTSAPSGHDGHETPFAASLPPAENPGDQAMPAGESEAKPRLARGRPGKHELFYDELIATMADGTSLHKALIRCGIPLTKRERDALRQRKEFKRLVKVARDKYQRKRFAKWARPE